MLHNLEIVRKHNGLNQARAESIKVGWVSHEPIIDAQGMTDLKSIDIKKHVLLHWVFLKKYSV